MTIDDILQNQILPFETDDEKLKKIFSFFLHSAPTIDSSTAANIPVDRLAENWNTYICDFSPNTYAVIAPNCVFKNHLGKYNLDNSNTINRKTKGFVCKRKTNSETEYESVFRHIRNSIAHSNVYMINAGNRQFILLEDFNKSKNQSARILLSQTDLQRLKATIMR